jgi:hypothetical protein
MDEIVRRAIAKWPTVPHCYGWLALDARGAFRMRDDTAQQAGLPGDIIRHSALLAFIYRNYAHDERGAWFFQNGPQRVYVQLEATPFIVRTDPAHQFVLHDGERMTGIHDIYLTDQGQLVLHSDQQVAMLDDRDLAHCLTLLKTRGQAIDDGQLLQWLDSPDDTLSMNVLGREVPVRWLKSNDVAARFGFIKNPLSLKDDQNSR